MKSILYINLFFLLHVSCLGFSQDFVNAELPLSRIIQEKKIESTNLQMLIDKSEHKLYVMADTIILKEYPVVFGGNPVGDKLRQGDKCTPEGTFSIKSKYEHQKWSKFIWIDYPNEQSWIKHRDAKEKGLIPENADIGGEIGIHGVPDGKDYIIDLKYNWTLGCISLKNCDINELYAVIPTRTQVTICK